ncbi:MAG: Ig-like domain-containing protein [Planctomycetales bacterium]|jgi:VCBS repeat-containing protein
MADATGSSTLFSAATIDGPVARTVALRTRSYNGVFALATATATVTNVAPSGNDDSGAAFTTSEDAALITGNVLGNDNDPGPELLTVSSIDTTGTIGVVTDRGDGTFDYNPNGQFESLAPGQSSTDTFTYTVTDGVAVDTASITILITGINDAPNATDQTVSVDENAAFNSRVATATASDADSGDSVSWTIVGGNTNGAFTVNATSGKIRVAKPLEIDFESTPSYALTVQAADENGGADTGLITISLNDPNETPTATDAAFNVAESVSAGTTVGLLSDADPDAGDTLAWSILGGNTNGAFLLNAATGELTIASPSTLDFESIPTYTLNIQVQDGVGLTDSAAVVVNILNTNEAPTTTGLSDVIVNEDSTDILVDLKAAFSDVETPSSALTYSIIGNSTAALFSDTPIVGGNLVLNFAADANGNAIVAVKATDPQELSVTAAFNVTVLPVADSPISNADAYLVLSDQVTVPPGVGVLANDSDPDDNALSAILISGPSNGSLVLLSNGGFTYTPDAEFVGIDTFNYQPFDGTNTGPTRTVVLNVTRVLAPPPPPATDSSNSSDDDSGSETETSEAVTESADIQSSSTASGIQTSSADAAPGVASSSDDDADEESS